MIREIDPKNTQKLEIVHYVFRRWEAANRLAPSDNIKRTHALLKMSRALRQISVSAREQAMETRQLAAQNRTLVAMKRDELSESPI